MSGTKSTLPGGTVIYTFPGEIVVYATGEVYVVSENRVWVDGHYATPEAAAFACSVPASSIHDLWERRGPTPLTIEDLRVLL